MAKAGEITPHWYLIDARNEVLGRAAVRIAMILMGKHRPTYTAHIDTGDFVVVINAAEVQATGAKDQKKIYQWYTGWPSGRKTRTLEQMRESRPEDIVRLAVRRMLPKSARGKLLILASYNFRGDFNSPEAIRAEVRRDGTVLDHMRLHATGVPSFYSAHGTVTLIDALPATRGSHVYELFLQSELSPRQLPISAGQISVIPLE